MMNNNDPEMINVELEDIQFFREIALQSDVDVELTVMIHYGNGSFEVSEGKTTLVTGFVRKLNDNNENITGSPTTYNSPLPMLSKDEFYKELRLRGYQYKNDFQSVTEACSNGLYGRVQWKENWVSFIDGLFQTVLLAMDTRSLVTLKRIQKVRISPMEHIRMNKAQQTETKDFGVFFNTELNVIQAGGVEIIGMITNPIVSLQKQAGELVLRSYKYVPHNPAPLCNDLDAIRICLQLLFENNPSLTNVKVLEVQSKERRDQVVSILNGLFAEIPMITSRMTLLTDQNVDLPNVAVETGIITDHTKCHLIILSDTLEDHSLLESCGPCLVNEGFLIIRHTLGLQQFIPTTGSHFHIIANIPAEADNIVLLRRKLDLIGNKRLVINISTSIDRFAWLDAVKESVKVQPVLLVAQDDRFSGIIGLINCIRLEPESKDVACMFIDDNNAPPFDLSNPFYAKQLLLNLGINVYRQVRT